MKNHLSRRSRKKIVLIGGMGTIGKMLQEGLTDTYELYVIDIREPSEANKINYIKADISSIEHLLSAIPDDAHALINLAGIPAKPPIPDGKDARHCSDVYVLGSYNVFLAAAEKGVGKVIFASTNHVTGAYEIDGESLLGREIKTDDYPLPDSAYGAMKLCAEMFGYLFFREKNISVITLRLGGVSEDDLSHVRSFARARRTIMSKRDTIEIFRKAIETQVKYGVYYAVSDNPGKPWDLTNTMCDLGFLPRENSQQLLKGESKKAGKKPY